MNNLPLSRRETELVHLIVKGYTAREAAELLGIGYQTARSYIKTVYQKLGIRKVTELMGLASDVQVAFREVNARPPLNASETQLQAYRIYKYAVKLGFLRHGPCEVCGLPITDGHHDDYSQPLNVRWLCKLHHLHVA